MANARNLRLTNRTSLHASPMNHDRTTNTNNTMLDQRVERLEELLNEQNSHIKQLENRLELLEKHILSQRDQIKNLEDQLTSMAHSTDGDERDPVASAQVKATPNVHPLMSPHDKVVNDTRTETEQRPSVNMANIQGQKQELKDDATETLQSLSLKNSNEIGNGTSSTTSKTTAVSAGPIRFMPTYLSPLGAKDQDPKKPNENNTEISGSRLHAKDSSMPSPANVARAQNSVKFVLKGYSGNGRAGESGNDDFIQWMDSRQGKDSLWANERYRRSLLAYIGKIYDQRRNVGRFLPRLRIEHNKSDELEQLYVIVNEFEKQSGAREALHENRTQTRSTSRFIEITKLFEYNIICPEVLGDLRILEPLYVEQIISRQSISAYFDMLPRPGFFTADVGEYLQLKKENIFGGNEHQMGNERITHVAVDLKKSTIGLVGNRVDLITALVVLHHVPEVDRMLAEFVRILRPNGYLIIREHNCKSDRSLAMKYLHFVHAFMRIARVDEFAGEPGHSDGNDRFNWNELKARVIEYTRSIKYRARDEWQQELVRLGFELRAILEYGEAGSNNPQELYYGVYQLRKK